MLGSDALTLAVASAVGALVATLPYGFRESLPRPAVLAIGGGAAYATFCLAVWAGARLATVGLPSAALDQPGTFAVVLTLNFLVVGLQVAIPYYCYAGWRFVAPLAGAFAGTVVVLFLFLGVNGETDPIALYPSSSDRRWSSLSASSRSRSSASDGSCWGSQSVDSSDPIGVAGTPATVSPGGTS
ncbi:hypothetical protein [Halorussus caseinilyticus]|uniref:Uncharacterized protein n=1 Tax=Halorussus caseinilyticus TaxID=3034025 RepID=A0ABD5WLA8_9EURY